MSRSTPETHINRMYILNYVLGKGVLLDICGICTIALKHKQTSRNKRFESTEKIKIRRHMNYR